MNILKRGIPLILFAGLLYFGHQYSDRAAKVYDEGVALGMLGDFDKARNKFTIAQKMDPSYAPVKGALSMLDDIESGKTTANVVRLLFEGFALSHEGHNNMAIDKINRAIELDSSYAVGYLNRGGMQLKIGDHERAIQNFSQAIARDPNYTAAYYNRGLIYINYTDKLQQGCLDWKKACDLGMCLDYRQLQADGHCPQ